MLTFFAIVGAIVVVYGSVRVIATVVDVLKYWHRGRLTPLVSALSIWPDCVKIVQACRDNGRYPFEDPIKLDWSKSPADDVQKLAGFRDPVGVIERQLELLFVHNGVADKMEIRRSGSLLYICSTG